ncbi:AAA family ATPase [Bisgaardia hudsonensis]|nr:AAA family ATPase [Bisgaardia hudsonensis]
MQLQNLTLEDILILRESVDIECKLAIGRDGRGGLPISLWETYSAFANTDGGIIILGTKEKKDGSLEIIGVENSRKFKDDFFKTINNRQKVSVNLLSDHHWKELSVDNKVIILIGVPRATRQQQPVYLNNNPLGNSFIRQHEGDFRLDDERVKRLLAEQTQDSRDDEILPYFGLDDLDISSLKVYRQRYANLNPSSDLNDVDDITFLRRIGAYGINRVTQEKGLTKAGLLMFGQHHHITEVFPNYFVDYQEREINSDKRWVDRVVADATWSGNLFDFYRKVYNKLIQDLKIPFEIVDGVRQDDTPVHVAIREALANCLVHADYSDRASVLVVKTRDSFEFRNPGLMRIPLEQSLFGGESDCRNRKLHQMFRFINIGEQAGSGIPKILAGWRSQHWIPPDLQEKREPNNQTVLKLKVISLFPDNIHQALIAQFGNVFKSLSEQERFILAIVKHEGTVNHARLKVFLNEHSTDLSKLLHSLVKNNFLHTTGGRWATYTLVGDNIINPDDVFNSLSVSDDSLGVSGDSLGVSDDSLSVSDDSLSVSDDSLSVSDDSLSVSDDSLSVSDDNLSVSDDSLSVSDDSLSVSDDSLSVSDDSLSVSDDSLSVSDDSLSVSDDSLSVSDDSLGVSDDSLGVSDDSLGVSGDSLGVNQTAYRDKVGRLCHTQLDYPCIDSLEYVDNAYKQQLYHIATQAREKKRLPPRIMEAIFLNLCNEQFITIQALAEIVDRKADHIRKKYLSTMVKKGQLELAFPTTPTHEKQSYRKVSNED